MSRTRHNRLAKRMELNREEKKRMDNEAFPPELTPSDDEFVDDDEQSGSTVEAVHVDEAAEVLEFEAVSVTPLEPAATLTPVPAAAAIAATPTPIAPMQQATLAMAAADAAGRRAEQSVANASSGAASDAEEFTAGEGPVKGLE